MKKIIVLGIIFFALVIVAAAGSLYAECYNEDACYKSYVSNNGENLVIAVNRDTDQIELYWSDKNQTWLKPDEQERLGLQRLYDKKLQLLQMQKNLDIMHNATWFNTNQNNVQRR